MQPSPLIRREGVIYGIALLLACGLMLAALFGKGLNNERFANISRDTVHNRLDELRSRLENNLTGNTQLLKGLVSVIATRPDLNQEQFAPSPSRCSRQNPSCAIYIGAAPDMVIRLMYPIEGNQAAIGLDYRTIPAQFATADRDRRSGDLVLAGPLELVQGGIGFIARIPIYLGGEENPSRFWGIISSVIDADRLYRDSGLMDAHLPIEVAIRGRDASGPRGDVFFGRADLFVSNPVLADIPLPSGSWQMAAVPLGGWPTKADNAWLLRAGFALVALLILVPFFALGRSIRATEAARRRADADKSRLESTLENTPNVAVQWYDREGRVRYWNHASESMYGWSAAEAIGKTLDRLMLGADETKSFKLLLEQAEREGSALGPYEFTT